MIRKLSPVLAVLGIVLLFTSCNKDGSGPAAGLNNKNFERSYTFSGSMPENVLRSYLSRSITMSGILFDAVSYDGQAPFAEDDERMVLNTGAKFIGRAIFMWGNDDNINNPLFLSQAKAKIERMHAADPEIIFQACCFEIVTPFVNNVAIPAYVFKAFNLPTEARNFRYNEMLNLNGKVGQWGGVTKGSAPDITRIETRLWYYFLATQYINIGVEAIHWGQVHMTGFDDYKNGYPMWFELIGAVRRYASENARRKFVLNDGHTRGIATNGRLLLDFHSFPMRFRDKAGETNQSEFIITQETMYLQSSGGATFSGWECSHLPYLVEFDNFGASSTPGKYDPTGTWHWGYDEITWFSLLPEKERNDFLAYAVSWLKKTDPIGEVQMPGRRVISLGNGTWGKLYRANTAQGNMTNYGYNQELTIKQIWNEN